MTETLRYKYAVELVRRSRRMNVQLSLIVRGYQFVPVFPLVSREDNINMDL